MRVLARISCTLAGLALAAPVAAWAGPPTSADPSAAAKPHKHRRTLFGGERLCAECQRARAKAEHGVNVPPPPPLPGPAVSGGECTACGAATQVTASHGPMKGAPGMASTAGGPGYAVVGAEPPVDYAATGADPLPVGVATPRMASRPAPAPARPGAGPRDASLMTSSYSPAPPVAPGANRPHVLSHLFGLSDLGRESRAKYERRREEAHASIPYGTQAPTVTELPAKAVYGR